MDSGEKPRLITSAIKTPKSISKYSQISHNVDTPLNDKIDRNEVYSMAREIVMQKRKNQRI